MEYPVITNLKEYEGYLPKQQRFNTKEIKALYQECKQLSKHEKDTKLAELLQQPIMVNTYRAAGVSPYQISDYIECVLDDLSEEAKNGMISDLYVIYGMSGVNIENNEPISEQDTWRELDRAMVRTFSVPMKKFVAEHLGGQIETTEKFAFFKKIIRRIKKCIFGSKGTASV